jgi:hypothetical protein
MKNANRPLLLAGTLSGVAALLHVAIIFGGAQWYRFFGAGEEMAAMAESVSWYPAIITLCIALVLFVWALYAFSGAGMIRRLPMLKAGLVVISVVYLVRGVILIPALIVKPEIVDGFLVWSSLICLGYGFFYAIGTRQVWSKLSSSLTG